MLRCESGHNWENFPNAISADANVTSGQLLCFFLVWLMELPFCFVHPTRIHYLFAVKGIVLPFATFGLWGLSQMKHVTPITGQVPMHCTSEKTHVLLGIS